MLKDLYSDGIKLDSKSKGQVLTPDYIVDYMCKSVLEEKHKEFLDSKEPMLILDPACGTGRFMLGIKDWCNKQSFNNYIMYNIDIDEKMVEATVKHAEEYKINAVVILGDALTNDFKKAWKIKDGISQEIHVEPLIEWFTEISKPEKDKKENEQLEFEL